MKRVVLHIGAPKTASTYLQKLLWRNRDLLAADGVLLPGRDQRDSFAVGFDIRDGEEAPTGVDSSWRGALDRAVAEIESSGCHTAVLSDERLAGANQEQIERTLRRLEPFEVDVVYCVRELAGLLTSEWQQTLKHNNRRDLDEWITVLGRRGPRQWFWRAHDLASVLTRWSADPRVRVHVITMPVRATSDDQMWQRFQQVVGWSVATDTRVPRLNESLGLAEARLLSTVQGRFPARPRNPRREDVIHRFVVDEVLRRRPDPIPILVPEAHRAWIEEESRRRIDFLRTSDFDLVGDLEELAVDGRRFTGLSEAEVETEMLDAAVDVITAFVDANTQSFGGLISGDRGWERRWLEIGRRVHRLATRTHSRLVAWRLRIEHTLRIGGRPSGGTDRPGDGGSA